MKYTFESHEIKNCWLCPFSKVSDFDDNELFCRLMIMYFNGNKKPENCPLEVIE